MTDFRVGDRVKVIDSSGFYSENIGRSGVVINIDDDSAYPITVAFENSQTDYGRRSDLELLSTTAPGFLLAPGKYEVTIHADGSITFKRKEN